MAAEKERRLAEKQQGRDAAAILTTSSLGSDHPVLLQKQQHHSCATAAYSKLGPSPACVKAAAGKAIAKAAAASLSSVPTPRERSVSAVVKAAMAKASSSSPPTPPPPPPLRQRRVRPPPPPVATPPPSLAASNKAAEAIVLSGAKRKLPTPRLQPERWSSLRSAGAKLYVWACATKLSGEGTGAMGGGSSADKLSRARNMALEKATRLLDYMSWHQPIGSRLSMDALREVGADDDSDDDEAVSRLARAGGGRSDVGRAIAAHLATFRFQSALELADDYDEADVESATVTESSVFEMPRCDAGVLSAASARAARTFALADDESSLMLRDCLSDNGDPVTPTLPTRKHASSTPTQNTNRPADLRPPIELYPRTRAVEALHDAVSSGDARLVKDAAIAGAGGSGRDQIGAFITMARALHVAAARDGIFGAPGAGIVELLVSLGADMSAPDALGATPLHVAAACGNASAAAALLRCASAQYDDGATTAASLRCNAGMTPLELALARRRDAREFFASLLCRTRSFDVEFDEGPLGIKLALVRHNKRHHTPKAAAGRTSAPRRRPPPPPPKSPPPPAQATNLPLKGTGEELPPSPADKSHRRSHSDDAAACRPDADQFLPRTLLVASVAQDCDARGELEPGDQLLAINGHIVACPDEAGFPTFMAALKNLPRPIRFTFVTGSFPHLSVEDDSLIQILQRFSPSPEPAHHDLAVPTARRLNGQRYPKDDAAAVQGDELPNFSF